MILPKTKPEENEIPIQEVRADITELLSKMSLVVRNGFFSDLINAELELRAERIKKLKIQLDDEERSVQELSAILAGKAPNQ